MQTRTFGTSPSLEAVDALLDELAAHSTFSQLERIPMSLRSPKDILRSLYRHLDPFEAAVLTQIILKDLHPLLYPLPARSASTALLNYNAASFVQLELPVAMCIWHWAMPSIYNVRANLDHAARLVEAIPVGAVPFIFLSHWPSKPSRRTAGRYAFHLRLPQGCRGPRTRLSDRDPEGSQGAKLRAGYALLPCRLDCRGRDQV